MVKPKLKDLQEFTKQYFQKRVPPIRWKKMEYLGLANYKKNMIFLNPNIPIDSLYYNKKGRKLICLSLVEGTFIFNYTINFEEGEQYFFVLLHEIAELKIQEESPKYFKTIRDRAIKEIKKKNRIRNKLLGKRGGDKKITIENIITEIDYNYSHLFETKGKRNENKWLNFRSWLGGETDNRHIKVERWAIKEFKKQRKKIKRILNI